MFHVSPVEALLSCSLFPVIYVASLYIWKDAFSARRDAPETIKKRFISVFIACISTTIYMKMWAFNEDIGTFFSWLGIHTHCLLTATILPLLLTMILFAGPLLFEGLQGDLHPAILFESLKSSVDHLPTWRNYFVGPFTEEYVFRACMCSLLFSAGFSHTFTILVTPLFFGLAHLHHIQQHLHKQGRELKDAWLECVFQLCYTTIFGTYSAFLFMRTGHFMAPFISHAFCNWMGFPRFNDMLQDSRKNVLLLTLVGGLLLFMICLFPLTDPSFFDSLFYRDFETVANDAPNPL